MRVGFIGLGVMGRAMAKNLHQAGHELTVYNRTPQATKEFAGLGVRVATSAREAAASQEAVITMVTDDEAVRDVYLGRGDVLGGAAPGALLIDMSTVSPETAREVAAAGSRQGARFLDAPVTGGDVGAIAGSLTIMVGGAPEDFERAQPLFSAMGQRIVHVGDVGSGQTMKLVGNLISGMTMMVVAEALALGLHQDLPLEKLEQVLPHSSAASFELGKTLERYRQDLWRPGFSAQNRLKDLRLAVEMAASAGIDLPLAPQALQRYESFVAAGNGLSDETSYLRGLLG